MNKILEASRGNSLKEEEGSQTKMTDELLRTYGKRVYRMLDKYYDMLGRALERLEKSATSLPAEAQKAFGLDQDSLDTASDKIDDLLTELDLNPSILSSLLDDLSAQDKED